MTGGMKYSMASVLLTALLAVFVICIVTVNDSVVYASETNQLQQIDEAHPYEFRCFHDKVSVNNSLPLKQLPVGLLVTNRVTHQLLTRLFAIFSREVLDFPNIWLVPFSHSGNLSSPHYEKVNMIKMLKANSFYYNDVDMSLINLEVWMPPDVYQYIPAAIHEAGSSMSPARFGWFVPESLVRLEFNIWPASLHYSVFFNTTNFYYSQYVITEDILDYLRNGTDFEEYQNPLCFGLQCVTLLGEYKQDTGFLISQIIETKSFLNILWLGKQFREKIRNLEREYVDKYRHQRFIVVHWTPSDFINIEIKFQMMSMPLCEEWESLQLSNCKYELTPILKFYSKDLEEKNEIILKAVKKFSLDDSTLKELLEDLYKMRQGSKNRMRYEDLYNEVACNWLKRHKQLSLDLWFSKTNMIQLLIGGIFPISDPSRGHQNLSLAVELAEGVINGHPVILKDYDLIVQKNDGQCKADVVMKAFIHYFNTPRMLGVLGPACSDTAEPIAGISKHTNMAVISYSAEGASFIDRQTYPYFFRTIGSNRQYEDVYIRLMQHFGWRRIASLTEDGQKYTEYISHMEANMKQTNLEFVLSKKYLHDASDIEMNKYLNDLKKKHAKIIIADIHNKNAEMILCEAYKLKMTAYYGYVWFLPVWLSKNWTTSQETVNGSCTNEELQITIDGHFSIEHRPFGPPNALMQENITIAEWLAKYQSYFPSKYVGFAYDAVWTYALAADKLIRENRDAINNMRSNSVVQRFVELIWQTDFNGLSGRVRFGRGGSRITDLNILQWRDFRYHEVGQFEPKIVGSGIDLHTDGGRLTLDDEAIVWLSPEQPPGDGTYDCSFSILAETLSTDCENAVVVFAGLMCLLVVVIISLISFFFWKKRYDRKIKRSAKIMKTFGIDLLTPSRSKFNTLDKWEIPKENVVVNRRLGEGAFGTVYGGEAQLGERGWTAVAVKTLKAGASTEDRIDFLSEAEAMKRFDNKNIVKLLGVCLQSEPIYTIMEFMLYGDLKTYLLARRHMVNDKIGDESDISPRRLTGYAMDIASGLEYLEQQKYVHRDIACRNCLVNTKRVVKLGDFGMARSIFDSDYYRFNRKGMLPVRWMAPESLALGMFTPSSDVWAYGVVLFEIITFGSFPFQGLTNNQVLEFVKAGNTLQIPAGVKPPLEGLLKACWNREAKKRPTAAEVVDYISNYPRLLTPCLDFPGASVQMPETESDELELLPKVRRPLASKRSSTLDVILSRTVSAEEFKCDAETSTKSTSVDLTILGTSGPKDNAKTSPTAEEFIAITPDGYSVMSPLLSYQTGESSEGSHQGSSEEHQQTTF